VAFQPPSLPGAIGLPMQFVIKTTEPVRALNEVSQRSWREALKSGMFIFLDTDLKIDQPQSTVEIDRDKAAQLGLKMSEVGGALARLLGGGYVNYFSLDGRSYKVIPQVAARSRLNVDQLLDYYIATIDGVPVPLSTVAEDHDQDGAGIAEPLPAAQFRDHVQGVRARRLAGRGARSTCRTWRDDLPQGYTIDYAGQARQFVQESSGFIVTFGFAMIIVFLRWRRCSRASAIR
jgi:multidrug efflux pump